MTTPSTNGTQTLDIAALTYHGFADPQDKVALRKAVDAPIFPLVEALNEIQGVTPLGSCCGHLMLSFFTSSSPYTYFFAPNRFAERLHVLLQQEQDTLRLRWSLTPMFHASSRIAFVLRGKPNLLQLRLPRQDVTRLKELVKQAAAT